MRNAAIHVHSESRGDVTWLFIGWAVEGGRAQALSVPKACAEDEAVVDAFLQLTREYGTELRLFVASPRVRAVLADAALPGLALVSVAVGPVREEWDRARRVMNIALAAVPRPVLAPRVTELEIATDASRGKKRRLAGIGFVTSTGGARSRVVKVPNVHVAEIEAIRYALESLPSHVERVTIYSDSRVALAALRLEEPSEAYETGPAGKLCRDRLERVRQGGTEVRLRWVRGHNGDRLNELADRVAKHARRSAEWNQPEVHNRFLAGIRAELKATGCKAMGLQPGATATADDYVAVR